MNYEEKKEAFRHHLRHEKPDAVLWWLFTELMEINKRLDELGGQNENAGDMSSAICDNADNSQ